MDLSEASDRLAEIPELKSCDNLNLFWETVRGNIATVQEAEVWAKTLFTEITPVIDDEDADYIAIAGGSLPSGVPDSETWGIWTTALKAETGRKGRGLFMPLRKALTGQERGPEMDKVLMLIGEDRARARLNR